MMAGKGPRRDGEKERFWREVIRRQRHGGLSVRGFCREEGLSEPSFHAWRRELARRGVRQAKNRQRLVAKQARFVSVELAPASVSTELASIECILPGGIVLRLPAAMEPAAIAAVLTSWERSRC
jgi:hypothetical protein